MKRLIPIAATCILLLTGCSDSGSDTTESSSSSAVTSPTASSSSTASSSAAPTSSSQEPTMVEPTTQAEAPAPAPAGQVPPVEQAPAASTFDPNSGDGYGPGQELPPLCERFPGQFDCNGNPIPQAPAPGECVGFGCSPEQDAELAELEGNATTLFWECMQAGGTEETCRQ